MSHNRGLSVPAGAGVSDKENRVSGGLPQFIALKEVRHIIVGWNAGVSLYAWLVI